jgi:hypothetical protein
MNLGLFGDDCYASGGAEKCGTVRAQWREICFNIPPAREADFTCEGAQEERWRLA